ncbi:MAG: c-type cytochrome biogenesis protein CcmI, partial [Methyloligellaceae bacterium]
LTDAANAWRELLKKSGEQAPWRNAVEQRLAAVEKETGPAPAEERTGKTNTADAGASAGKNTLRGPTQEDVSAAGQMSATDRSAMIKQMVSGLAERLKSDGGSVDEWTRLIRSYVVLGDKQAASSALSEARGAFANDQKALASLGELASSLGL